VYAVNDVRLGTGDSLPVSARCPTVPMGMAALLRERMASKTSAWGLRQSTAHGHMRLSQATPVRITISDAAVAIEIS
jgi:hypothetical protein